MTELLTNPADAGWDPAAVPPARPLGTLPDLALADPGNDPAKDFFRRRLEGGVPRVIARLGSLLPTDVSSSLYRLDEYYRSLPASVRQDTVDHPLFHFCWLKIMEAARDGDVGYVTEELLDLGRFLLLPLVHSGLSADVPLPVIIRDGELRFPGHGRHLRFDNLPSKVPATVTHVGDDLVVTARTDRFTVPLADLLSVGSDLPAGSPVRQRRVVPGTGIELDGADHAIGKLFASMNSRPVGPDEPLYDLEVMTTVPDAIERNFGDAVRLLELAYPEVLPELNSYTKLVVPFLSRHRSTFTENAFMGAVFMSESRQPFSSQLFTAEHLLHEHSHLRMALIMEIDPLYHADPTARFASPWRTDERPLLGLVQGAFVFARIARFLNGAYAATDDRGYLDRRTEVLADLRAALHTLSTTRDITYTELGQRLLAQYATEADTANGDRASA